MLLLLAALAAAPPDSLVHSGRADRLQVPIPRIEAAIQVDGVLDEPAWGRAPVLTGFTTHLPADGAPAADSTEVRLWYAPGALHVGIRAYEPHGAVRATLADRDRIDGEDHVQILLDTFDDRRQAYVLAVNALGVQADGTRTENAANYTARLGMGNVDLSPDFVFESKGRVTEWGYEVEMRIPFKSLRYGRGLERWGVNVVRQVQHSGHQDTWAPVRRADPSFLARSGTLTGITGIRRGLSLDVNPVFTSTTAGAREGEGWRYSTEPALGGNVRWGITPDLTLNATVRPDFSQVEADAGQIPGDARYAVYFPERRPFFVDGMEQFDVPNQLIYTRRIVEPAAAAKLTGKLGGTEVAFLSAADGAAQSADGERNPLFHVLRLRRGIGGRSTLGLALTDRTEGGGYNRVASVDARVMLGATQLGLQAAGSATRADGRTIRAPLWEASLSHSARQWGAYYQLTGVDPAFRADAGFVERTDRVSGLAVHRVAHTPAPGGLLESLRGRLTLDGTWLYDDFRDGAAPLETKAWLESGWSLRGGWHMALIRMFESFAFDPREYAHYRVERTDADGVADTVAFTVSPRQHTGGWYFTGKTPRWEHVSASWTVFRGMDPFFHETLAARRSDVMAQVDWVPGDRLRLSASYARSRFVRPDDGSRASVLDIPRVKAEYQIARPLFVRVVGEYASSVRDALRDPATGAPILVPGADGALVPAARREANDLRLDWLLSYEPTPGTVVFAGYGSNLTEPERFGLRRMERTRDGFFVKLSYVFRP